MADSAPWSWPGVCPSIKINLYTGKAPCERATDACSRREWQGSSAVLAWDAPLGRPRTSCSHHSTSWTTARSADQQPHLYCILKSLPTQRTLIAEGCSSSCHHSHSPTLDFLVTDSAALKHNSDTTMMYQSKREARSERPDCSRESVEYPAG